jgi:hypothetical protein
MRASLPVEGELENRDVRRENRDVRRAETAIAVGLYKDAPGLPAPRDGDSRDSWVEGCRAGRGTQRCSLSPSLGAGSPLTAVLRAAGRTQLPAGNAAIFGFQVDVGI